MLTADELAGFDTPSGGDPSGNNPSGPDSPSSPEVDFSYKEATNVTLSYGAATIHIGQKWSSTIENQLAAGCSGKESITRKNFIAQDIVDPKTCMGIASRVIDEKVYMYDTGDYDNFLAVYVAGDQIIKWATNRTDMGSEDGVALTKGDTDRSGHRYFMLKNEFKTSGNLYGGIDPGGVFIGGFYVEEDIWVSENWQRNIADEKRVGFHFINAYRKAFGSDPLEYSDELDGGDNICTETYTTPGGKQYTNSRYGAQPFAETNDLSGRCTHDVDTCTKGPLAGQGSGTRDDITYLATGVIVRGENIGTGYLGEGCLTVYKDSVLHLSPMCNPSFTKIGIGISGSIHAEQFAK